MALIRDNEWIRLLRDEKFDEFNRIAETTAPNLENGDLRMIDLRKTNLRRANLKGAYLRDADLRGVDLSDALMDGASIHSSHLGGTLFPRSISAAEIALSHAQGTRMRAHLD
ncbi:MAG: pentapeptide repeat-containing protein [Planctomycetes bacterium]|nr:pentapeptide repeat-containing protein [Planctomycetota bacterium]MBI3845148.1 pentapeptide repeat-containing protein [Planctomycetota bacterium]